MSGRTEGTKSEFQRLWCQPVSEGEELWATMTRIQEIPPLECDLPLEMESMNSETDFCRLFLKDKISGLMFSVNPESYICMYPKNKSWDEREQLKREHMGKLKPGSVDTVLLELDFSLEKRFKWSFIIADVEYPVIGLDFLNYYNLHVDFKNKLVIDGITKLSTKCETLRDRNALSIPPQYERLLKQFPRLKRPLTFEQSIIKHDVVHHIYTTPGPPVTTCPRKLTAEVLDMALAELTQMIASGQAVGSTSSWSSPVIFTPKQEGGVQLGGDYRALNARTITDRYPLPHIEDFTKSLHGKKVFSNISLYRTYSQIPIAKSDVCKTAVLTPFGLFEFPTMCFGLRNTAQTYQRFIDRILNGLDFVFGYLSTVLVASASENEHLEHLEILFRRLDDFDLTIDFPKCVFGVTKITFLGYSFSEEGMLPAREKVETVINFPKPIIVQQLREFLGMVNFYRRFIPKAGDIIKPLNDLQLTPRTGRDIVQWTPQADEAFENIKIALDNVNIIPHPISNARLSIMCGTTDCSVEATLQQLVNGSWQPLSYFTKSLTFSQRNYGAYDRSLYCIYAAIRRFRYLIGSRHFIVFTDHKSLTFAFSKPSCKHSSRQFNFLDFIGQFTTDIRYIDESDKVSTYHTLAQYADNTFRLLSKTNNYSNVEQSSMFQWGVPSTATGSFPIRMDGTSIEGLPLSLPEGQMLTARDLERTSYIKKGNNESQYCAMSQRPPVQRQITAPPALLPTFGKFEQVHLDLIGPLPPMRGFSYCLTCIDRSSRWPEVIPLENIEDETIARAFISTWVARFGVPGRITTNRGIDFDSLLFQELFKILGIAHSLITNISPDDEIEQHRNQLESAIKSPENINWVDSLPVVLLGMRTAIKKDISKPSTELLYGSTLRLPDEFFETTDFDECMSEFVDNLRRLFRQIQPYRAPDRNARNPFICKDLRSSSHVYVRIGGVRRILHPVFEGPYRVIEHNSKTSIIEKHGRQDALSTKQLKPAHFHQEGNDDDEQPYWGPFMAM